MTVPWLDVMAAGVGIAAVHGMSRPAGDSARRAVAAVLIAMGATSLLTACLSLGDQWVWHKDFSQYWLTARAVHEGIPPYLFMDDLASRLTPEATSARFHQATPYPPAVILLLLPLGCFSYRAAASMWLVAQFAALALAVWLAWRELRPNQPWAEFPVVLSAVVAWHPVSVELSNGLFTPTLLLSLAVMWLALRRDRPLLAGVMLGFALTAKFIGWPVVAILLVLGLWRAATAAVLSFALGQAAALVAFGWTTCIDYYRVVGPAGGQFYRHDDLNIALWGLGFRLVEGTYASLRGGTIEGPALLPIPVDGEMVAVLLLGTALAVLLGCTWKNRNVEGSVGGAIALSAVAGPIGWPSYLVLLVLPAMMLLTRRDVRFASVQGLLLVPLLLPTSLLQETVRWTGRTLSNGTTVDVPALLTLLPASYTVATLVLMVALIGQHFSGRLSGSPSSARRDGAEWSVGIAGTRIPCLPNPAGRDGDPRGQHDVS